MSLSGYLVSIEQTRADLKKAKQQLKVKDKIKTLEKIEAKIDLLEQEQIYIRKVIHKKHETEIAVSAHKVLVKKYIEKIKKNDKCPTCFGQLTIKALRRIKNAISIAI